MGEAPATVISRPAVPGVNAPQFDSLARKAEQSFGYLNFTVLQWIEERHALKRIYSSDPVDYPVMGEKAMPKDAPWILKIVHQGKPHTCWTVEDLKATYTDAPTLIGQGIVSCLCIPILDTDGTTLGSVNYSGGPDQYTEDTFALMEDMAKTEAVTVMRSYLDNQNA